MDPRSGLWMLKGRKIERSNTKHAELQYGVHRHGRDARQQKEADVFVPEGPDDGSQAIYCLEQVQSRIRPGGYGMTGWREEAIVPGSGPSVAPQITPFPTGRIMFTQYQAFHAWLPSFRPSGTTPYR